MIVPRLSGEMYPHSASTTDATSMRPTCTPVPTIALSSISPCSGGRNTSACTIFHPLSSVSTSSASSVGSYALSGGVASTRLYRAKSWKMVRTTMKATMP